jgi:hypothetical protein
VPPNGEAGGAQGESVMCGLRRQCVLSPGAVRCHTPPSLTHPRHRNRTSPSRGTECAHIESQAQTHNSIFSGRKGRLPQGGTARYLSCHQILEDVHVSGAVSIISCCVAGLAWLVLATTLLLSAIIRQQADRCNIIYMPREGCDLSSVVNCRGGLHLRCLRAWFDFSQTNIYLH